MAPTEESGRGKLDGRVAVVTGGGRGIGRAIALAFAAEGADLCLVARTERQLEAVAAEVRGLSRRAAVIPTDVTDPGQVDRMAERLRSEFGRVDLLVNNAGGGTERRGVLESDPRQWVRDIEVNLISAYLVSRAVLPLMIESCGGRVINVGSGMGHSPGRGAYTVAKAGMWMLTQSLSKEVWQHGIDVNELIPGPVETELTRGQMAVGDSPPFAPSERVKYPEEVAPLAVWLATQPEGGPTGQSFSLARRPL